MEFFLTESRWGHGIFLNISIPIQKSEQAA